MSRIIRALPGRLLITLALVLLVGLGTSLTATTAAHAGSNAKEGHCIRGWNYADPASGYLFAATEGKMAFPEPCGWVHVWILNGCQETLVYEDGGWYVSTSTTLHSQRWISPCSRHMGEWHIETWSLSFVY